MIFKEDFDNPIFTWKGDWVYNGNYMASSNFDKHNSTSAAYTIINFLSDGYISFNCDLISEVNFDILRFYIDNVLQYTYSGYQVTREKFEIRKGLHSFNWTYSKNATISAGSDRAKIVDFIVSFSGAYLTLASLRPSITHDKSIQISGTVKGDYRQTEASHRILINGKPAFPYEAEFTQPREIPYSFNVELGNRLFDAGESIVTVETRDSMSGILSYNYKIKKNNVNPTIEATIEGPIINCLVSDEDGDKVRIKAFLNGKQLYPQCDMMEWLDTPHQEKIIIPKKEIIIGSNNIVIEVEDVVGGRSKWEQDFIGEYYNVLFCDQNEQCFTTDLGELVKYLNFGRLDAGESSNVLPLWVKNNLGFTVSSIRIWNEPIDIDVENTTVKISLTDSPFEASDTLLINKKLSHGEKLKFFIKVSTTQDNCQNGLFRTCVEAVPISE